MDDAKHSCPSCGEHFEINAYAELPEQTDLTLGLKITPGQLCMAETVGKTMQNFADLQVAVGQSLGCDVSVFIAGLSYENDEISMTFRILNKLASHEPAQGDLL